VLVTHARTRSARERGAFCLVQPAHKRSQKRSRAGKKECQQNRILQKVEKTESGTMRQEKCHGWTGLETCLVVH